MHVQRMNAKNFYFQNRTNLQHLYLLFDLQLKYLNQHYMIY